MDSLERRLGVCTELSANSRDCPQEQQEDVGAAPLQSGHHLLAAVRPVLPIYQTSLTHTSFLLYSLSQDFNKINFITQFVQLYFDNTKLQPLLLLLKIVKSSIRIKLNLHCSKASSGSVSRSCHGIFILRIPLILGRRTRSS